MSFLSRQVASAGVLAMAFALFSGACALPPVDLEDKQCPCSPGWVCNPQSNRCEQAQGDAGSSPGGFEDNQDDDVKSRDAAVQEPPDAGPGPDAEATRVDSDGDGVADDEDGCLDDRKKVEEGLCGCGVRDDDQDLDGTPDCDDACPDDALKTALGLCGCNRPDEDADADGLPDCSDECPDDALKRAPGVCDCGFPDTDRDHDTVPDCIDGCPDDAAKLQQGVCGCGQPDVDGDEDMTPNCVDQCPFHHGKTIPGVCGCGVPDADSDGDGALDCTELCPNDPLKLEPQICGCNVAEGTCPLYSASRDSAWKNEGVLQAFDGRNNTKWYADGTANWIQVQLPGDGEVYDRYSITSANDRSDRDPRDFRLLGSQDGLTFQVLDTRTGELFSERFQTRHFSFPNATQYRYYRLDISATLDPSVASNTQLAELSLSFQGLPDDCPTDPHKIAAGVCGCGTSDVDSDRDGSADCLDGCPQNALLTSPGACSCGQADSNGVCQWTTRLLLDDALVSSSQSQTNFGARSTLSVDSDSPTYRSFIKPQGLGDIPVGAQVIDAFLVLYVFDGGNDPSVRPLVSSWDAGTVTYNAAPGMGTAFATLAGGRGGKTSVAITAAVQAWVDGAPAYGFGLEPTGSDRVDMRSANYPAPQERPYIEVRWTAAP